MKRDLELVREILLRVEDADRPISSDEIVVGRFTDEEIRYHLALMMERNLIDGTFAQDDSRTISKAVVLGLTWDGCDYLDAIRDMRVWSRVKKAIRESVGSTTFEVVKAVAVKAAEMSALSAL